MPKSFLELMNNIEAMKPTSTEFSFIQRGKWMYDIALKHYRDFGVLKAADLLLTTAVLQYDLTAASTQIDLPNVQHLYVTCTKTTCSTDIEIDTKFDEYTLTDIYDPVNPNYITFPSYFDDERMLRVQYVAIPALFPTTSGDSSTIIDIDEEAFNAIEFGVLARICKAGDAPDVQLANAYEEDYREEVKRLKAALRNRSRKMANDRLSYKEWDW